MARGWVRGTAIVALLGGLFSSSLRDADAAPPTLSFGAERTAVVLPAGCPISELKIEPTGDGVYHGWIWSECADAVNRLFYVQRGADGRWSLQGTALRLHPDAMAVDGTGTYLVSVAVLSERVHRVELIRRNNDGSYSALHVLSASVDYPREATVTASRGNYWVVWTNFSNEEDETQPADTRLYESRTMPAPLARTPIVPQRRSPALVLRPGHGVALLSVANDVDTGTSSYGRYGLSTNDGTHGWTSPPAQLGSTRTPVTLSRVTVGDTAYVATQDFCGRVAQPRQPYRVVVTRIPTTGPVTSTELGPANGADCAGEDFSPAVYADLIQVGGRLWGVGTDTSVAFPNGWSVWKGAADGSLPVTSAATFLMPHAAVNITPLGIGSRLAMVYSGSTSDNTSRVLYEVDSQ